MDILALEEAPYPDVSDAEDSEAYRPRVMSVPPGFGREKQDNDLPDVLVTRTSPGRDVELEKRGGRDSPDMKGGTGTRESLAQPVLMKGNLQKLGKIFKTWHQRYFEVQGSHMFYYKTSQKKDCFGTIDLNICFKCESTKAATFGHPFRLETTERTHTFSARTNEEMDEWLTAIQNTMGGPAALDGKQKRSKPKRWESFKNTFSIQPKPHINGSPEHSLPAKTSKKSKKSTHRIKVRGAGRSRSPSPHVEAEVPFHKRPMSFHGEQFPTNTLQVLPEVAPTRSLPTTPLIKKREATIPLVPPSPDLSQGQESDATGDLSRTATPVSIEVHEHEEAKSETSSKPKPIPPPRKHKTEVQTKSVETSPSPSPLPQEVVQPVFSQQVLPVSSKQVRPVSPQPEIIIEHVTPEFLRRTFVWDEVREILDTTPDSEVANYDDLPTEEQSWLEQPSAIEQLRTFLAVCP